MAEFIYNDGTRRHRGVWHLVEGQAVKTVVPEEVKSSEHQIRDWHLDKCALNQRTYDYRTGTYRAGPECDCGHSGDVIGSYTQITITPEHLTVFAQRVACNQVSHLKQGGVKWLYSNWRTKHEVGETYTQTQKIEKPLYVEGDEFPAGPWCSRCEAKLEKRLGTSNNEER